MIARTLNITAAEYHADPCATPSLSSSIAHTLISKSPLHAWMAHPKLGGGEREATASMNEGTLLHAIMLGKGGDIVPIDADSFRSKAAREARDGALAAGNIPVLAEKLEEAQGTVRELRDRLAALGYDLDGDDGGASEVVVVWDVDLGDRGFVQCRGMIDRLIIGKNRATILDLKTSRSAHPRACASHAIEYGYHIQQVAYSLAVSALYPDLAGKVDMTFLFAETEPPYCVTPVRLGGTFRELGMMQWDRAIVTWAECLRTGTWPGYTDENPTTLEAPAWALTAELGKDA